MQAQEAAAAAAAILGPRLIALIALRPPVHHRTHSSLAPPCSLHGKVGLCAFGLALAAPLLGACSFRWLGLIQRFPEPWQPRLKWLHRLVGSPCVGGLRAAGR